MSTDYRIVGHAKPTLDAILALGGIRKEKCKEHEGCALLTDGENWLHVETRRRGNGPERILFFTRFGGNNPSFLIDAIETLDFCILSEHDEGFF